ncbi:MAG: S41 family peptidase, partial [Candidatus Omnitrophota bacterium]|nr:S41 family peptidase [Candidatus Omnitrophota bacterium]
LIYGALKGMLSSLDDFSQFMEPDEYNEIKLETKGEFGGIGIEISLKDGILTIVTPLAGTPGETAGLKPGDKIVKIDGVITKEITLNEAVKKMRGAPGSMVTLTIWREKEERVLDIPIKRDIIKIHSIKNASMLEDKIGYIKLVEFQERTPQDLDEALEKLESEGMESLILDLRNNPGGLLDVAVDVAERFIPKDQVIVSIKTRTPSQDVVFKSSGKSTRALYPIVILVNEGSASGSEIVAGAIQDDKRGVIVGKKTYGKASVQTVIPMKDGSALRLTTAAYLTPSGKLIRKLGIVPDIVVEKEERSPAKEEKVDIFEKLETKPRAPEKEKTMPEEKKPEEKKIERDNQLQAAINLLKGLKVYKNINL